MRRYNEGLGPGWGEPVLSFHQRAMTSAAAMVQEVRGWTLDPGRAEGPSNEATGPTSHDRTVTAVSIVTESSAGRALVRQFGLLSFVVIGIITLILSLVIAYNLRRDLLEREWGTTADFIRTEALQYLTPADFHAPMQPGAQENFERLYHEASLMPEIIRVKIYDTRMAVVWSSEPRLQGLRFPDNPHLARALGGQTTVNLDTEDSKDEHIYERNSFTELIEVYVPIVFPGSSRVVGVVETYKMPTHVIANIRRAQITVAGTATCGGLFLYLSLFWIVRRAARRLDQQHRDLAYRTQELATANQELRVTQARLLEAERLAAIGEVVTAVAHGIRNPLANIRAAAQVAILDRGDRPGTHLTPRNLGNIMSEVDRLEVRLKELLQFARPADRPRATVDLNGVLHEALQLMAGRFARTRLRLTQDLAPALPAMPGNAMLLEQVFLSLLGNALEALPEGDGTITLRTGVRQNGNGTSQIFAEVRDTGPGIPPESLSKIFEPFYTTKAQGTGLGLAIAKKFTEAHGGSLCASNPPGGGATFRLTFPVPASA